MAPLLQLLWRLGVDTLMSCQGDGDGQVWIQFPNSFAAERFLCLVANYVGASPPSRVTDPTYLRMTDPRVPDAWEYDVFPVDPTDAPNGHGGTECPEPAEFLVAVSVRFPRTDRPHVFDALSRAEADGGRFGGNCEVARDVETSFVARAAQAAR